MYGQSTSVARTMDSRGVVAVRKRERGRVAKLTLART